MDCKMPVLCKFLTNCFHTSYEDYDDGLDIYVSHTHCTVDKRLVLAV